MVFPKLFTESVYSFKGCTSLRKLKIGGRISNIGSQVFYGCSSLEALIFSGIKSVPSLGNNNALSGTPIAAGTGYVYVPSSLVDRMKQTTRWSNVADQIRAIEDYPDIVN